MGKIIEELGNAFNEIADEIRDENKDKSGFSYNGSLTVCVGNKMYAGSITIAGNNVSIILN